MKTCGKCKFYICSRDGTPHCWFRGDQIDSGSPICESFKDACGKESSRLKPCTCGGKPLIVTAWNRRWGDGSVRCSKCGAETMVYTTTRNAVKAWNEGRVYYFDDLIEEDSDD